MIEIAGLCKSFGEFVAVRDLSFAVRRGEVLGLVGPNGAGKTTTLRVMAGIIPPTRGNVRIGGHDIAAEPIQAKQCLAFFPDEPRLFDYLTVRQHLAFVARLYGVQDHEARSMPLLEALEIADRANYLPGELARGMKQKLAIACDLLHSPSVMIFDEPLTGLDPLGIRRMKDSILCLPGEHDDRIRGRCGGGRGHFLGATALAGISRRGVTGKSSANLCSMKIERDAPTREARRLKAEKQDAEKREAAAK